MFWQDELSLQDVRELSIGDLVALGECSYPDSEESPGALFLGYVKRDVIEALEDENWSAGINDTDIGNKATEIANEAPSDHNHTRSMEFTDLAAWNEEPELGEWPEGPALDVLGVALYQIAQRIAYGIFERYIAWRDNQEEDDEFEDDEDGDDLMPANAGSSE